MKPLTYGTNTLPPFTGLTDRSQTSSGSSPSYIRSSDSKPLEKEKTARNHHYHQNGFASDRGGRVWNELSVLSLVVDGRAQSILLLAERLVEGGYGSAPPQRLDVFFAQLPLHVSPFCHRGIQNKWMPAGTLGISYSTAKI